jgi:hypothetical protein
MMMPAYLVREERERKGTKIRVGNEDKSGRGTGTLRERGAKRRAWARGLISEHMFLIWEP